MSLAKIQFLSLATKAVTTALGLIQSFLIIRLLSKPEFGLVGLVLSIGGLIGVFQHLGIVDGAIREIAVLKDRQAIGKLFLVANILRQLITIPLSIILFIIAPFVAGKLYHHPEITLYLQLFSFVLILQGLQDVLGATLTGIKAFRELYFVQIITATLNIIIFGYLVWQFNVNGFFWAMIITTTIMICLFGVVLTRHLRQLISWPSWQEIRLHSSRVLGVGVFMYLSRILYTIWNRLPILVLGGVITGDQLGYLNISLTFGARLTIIAAALSEVNLSWMSSLFAHNPGEFRATAERNMQRLFILMLLLTIPLNFFTHEIITIIKPAYYPAESFIILMTTAFFLYTLIDIGTSSIFVAANRSRIRTAIHLSMTLVTGVPILWLLWSQPHPLFATAAVLSGGIIAYAITVISADRLLNIKLLPTELFIFLIAFLISIPWLLTHPVLWLRSIVFVVFIVYIAWESYRKNFWPQWLRAEQKTVNSPLRIICFAGATYTQPSWTNRQHMMSRVSQKYPVLYIEPRRWVFRVIWHHWNNPKELVSFFMRCFLYEKKHEGLYIKSQLNLIPGSREVKAIAFFNHAFNRLNIYFWSWWLGFVKQPLFLWLYDTEAAEYLSAFPQAHVIYDCVDDHAVQAGIDRNPERAREEEQRIMQRADIVTVTSQRLYELKKNSHSNIHLVLNAGDVEHVLSSHTWPRSLLEDSWKNIPHPILGTVGALDSYKVDFDLIDNIAGKKPEWHFVFIGAPVVDQKPEALNRLRSRANVHFLGVVSHEYVPAEVQHFDVCLIPYRANQYNQASFPLKFWEFMAAGKPIVVTGLPELKNYNNFIGYADSPEECIEKIELALKKGSHNYAEQISLAKNHSWEKRVAALLNLLEEILTKKYAHRI